MAFTYRYGGEDGPTRCLKISDDLLAVRTKERKALRDAVKGKAGKRALAEIESEFAFPEVGVTVLKVVGKTDKLRNRNAAIQNLEKEPNLRFVGKVLRGADGNPVVYTENVFVKFEDGMEEKVCLGLLDKYGVSVKVRLGFAKNAWFAAVPEGTGTRVFGIAERLLDEEGVVFCHPELVRPRHKRNGFRAGERQWHLAERVIRGQLIDNNVNAEMAWQITRGAGVTIAVIDDGVDIDHEEFNGTGKIVHPVDVSLNSDDPRPKTLEDNHGTACAGVACASGKHGAVGVAPEANLMPVRLVHGAGSILEAEAIYWAAAHGADVISCSWGPPDGPWWNPYDPRHLYFQPMPDSTREAIDWAIRNGRGGKGCVIAWAAGNGNEPVDLDGYASYEKVIAVAACNDRGTRSVYSDYGQSIWCCFPSNDMGQSVIGFDLGNPTPYLLKVNDMPLSPGVWTTDREGAAGYNPGELNPFEQPSGDDFGIYTDRFGGTSSACPGVAGIAALILSANPELGWLDVMDILRRSAVQIDPDGGDYDDAGHSYYYGYGRPDAYMAVRLARAEAGDSEAKKEIEDDPVVMARDAANPMLKISLSGALSRYQLKLNGTLIPMLNRKGQAPLRPGVNLLSWVAWGNPDATFTIHIVAPQELAGALPPEKFPESGVVFGRQRLEWRAS